MKKYFDGINLLDIRFIAYAQWLLSHADVLPQLATVGQALISEVSTVKQRLKALQDILAILLTIIEDAPDQIFGAEEEVPQEVFTSIADASETAGLNVLLLINIVAVIMSFMKK